MPELIEDLGMDYPTEKSKQKKRFGIYRCPFCNTLFKAQSADIKSKRTQSCGCYQLKRTKETHTVHGQGAKTKLYALWNRTKDKTSNPNHISYKDYGAKGISMCPEWRDSFVVFKEWCEQNGYKEGDTLIRIDLVRDYCPSNCKVFPIKSPNKRLLLR